LTYQQKNQFSTKETTFPQKLWKSLKSLLKSKGKVQKGQSQKRNKKKFLPIYMRDKY